MSRLIQLLNEKEFSLIVSLPANDMNLVKAAIDGGADAIKVHMNVFHRASGTSFGTLQENLSFFEEMNQLFTGPTGIVPGDEPRKITQEDIHSLKDIGFDFLSLYAHAAPAWLQSLKELSVVVAVSDRYCERELEGVDASPFDMLEASIIQAEAYGSALTLQDLWHYRYICQRVHQPVIVPSQKRVAIEDLPALRETGVKGLMIGAIVTGTTADEVYVQTKKYKNAITMLRREPI
ncbi:hypothetical protein ACI2OX_08265 [Bacillus sp. N9]